MMQACTRDSQHIAAKGQQSCSRIVAQLTQRLRSVSGPADIEKRISSLDAHMLESMTSAALSVPDILVLGRKDFTNRIR